MWDISPNISSVLWGRATGCVRGRVFVLDAFVLENVILFRDSKALLPPKVARAVLGPYRGHERDDREAARVLRTAEHAR